MSLARRLTRTSVAVAAAAAVLLPALPASAAEPDSKTEYTHKTTLKRDCTMEEVLPGSGNARNRNYVKAARSNGRATHVGVRYTTGAYALVLDYARAKDDLHWVFVSRDCLTNSRAYDRAGKPLPDETGTRGGPGTRRVDMGRQAAPTGGKTITLSGRGTLRDAPRAFVIGNLRKDDRFTLRGNACHAANAQQWVYGYSSAAGRWGFVQAGHLPACRR